MTNEIIRAERIKLLNEKKQKLLKHEEKNSQTINKNEVKRNARIRMIKRKRR